MHVKKFGRWLKLILATLTISTLIGFTFQTSSQAVSLNPTPVCTEGTCWVTFDYTGDRYVWTPPSDISSLHFEVFGAQGGRIGGKGGLVTGDFAAIPTELQLYVGGVGGSGNLVAGGFNGGGTSGNGHADQGSGGGASDIRTSVALADRIVVAGGGGGTGGYIGGVGGAGGLTVAENGTRGATTTSGGYGGTQVAGGNRGTSTTLNNANDGVFGSGGSGASNSFAGGGGGGGGYFGGGGGGSDTTSGGGDGAGGGGGSSFALMSITTNVVHQAGVKDGNGKIVLSYTRAPKVVSFTPVSTSVSTASPKFLIVFDQLVTDLDRFDFTLIGSATGCSISEVLGDGYSFSFELLGCTNGSVKPSIHPNAVLGASRGPTTEVSAEAETTIDNVIPGFTITAPASPVKSSALTFQLTSDESFATPTSSAFQIYGEGCVLGSIIKTSTTTVSIGVNSCVSGANVSIKLLSNKIADISGNLGPAVAIESPKVIVDTEAPKITSLISNPPTADLVEYLLTFDEPVTGLTTSSFTLNGAGCSLSKLDGSGTSYNLWLAGCTESPTLKVNALAVSDQAGNLGPTTGTSNGSVIIDKTPPTAVFSELERIEKNSNPVFEITFDEKISGLTIDTLTRSGTAKNCTFNLIQTMTSRVYRIETANCSLGTVQLTLPARSVTDLNGNSGPQVILQSPIASIAPKPAAVTNSTVQTTTIKNFDNEATPETEAITSSKEITKTPIIKTPVQKPAKFSPIGAEIWLPVTIAIAAMGVALRPRKGSRRAITRR